jgi:hypothetical protein
MKREKLIQIFFILFYRIFEWIKLFFSFITPLAATVNISLIESWLWSLINRTNWKLENNKRKLSTADFIFFKPFPDKFIWSVQKNPVIFFYCLKTPNLFKKKWFKKKIKVNLNFFAMDTSTTRFVYLLVSAIFINTKISFDVIKGVKRWTKFDSS